jgi:hypothetical protein
MTHSSSYYNAHDYSTSTNKKLAKLETDFGLLKKRLDTTLPSYNIKTKFESHTHRLLRLEGNYYKKDNIPELKKEIRKLIMSELIKMEIVDENELDPPINPEEEETENEIDS